MNSKHFGHFTPAQIALFFKSLSAARIVPLVSHLDHSEHSVQIIITEQGVADLRGKSPSQRAETIISNCAHPDYRTLLRDYVRMAGSVHSPQTLSAAFGLHQTFSKGGDMRKVSWGDYLAR